MGGSKNNKEGKPYVQTPLFAAGVFRVYRRQPVPVIPFTALLPSACNVQKRCIILSVI